MDTQSSREIEARLEFARNRQRELRDRYLADATRPREGPPRDLEARIAAIEAEIQELKAELKRTREAGR